MTTIRPAVAQHLAPPASNAPAAPTHAEPGLRIPEWVKGAVFYQVFPDRFANGDLGNDPTGVLPWGSAPTNDAMLGGDLDGVTQKLGYLTRLGVNALYLNPIFQSPSNHKYNTTDHDVVDEAFGGDAAFRKLTDAAHNNGVKVVLDGVLNHVSHQHKWFKDVRERGPKSPYFDRFTVTNWPITYRRDEEGVLRSDDYASWWNYATLPVLRTDHPAVREAFLTGPDAVVKRWMRDGRIDGWRMDVADDTNFTPDFWRTARREIKGVNPDAYLVAENWQDASSMLHGDQFDGSMNYKYFTFPAIEFFGTKQISADEFVRRLDNGYSDEARLGAFNILDSHDTSRFITAAGGDWYRQRPAAIFQMTYPGAPVIYYGDEIGMEGGKDPDSRRSFDWSLVPNGSVDRARFAAAALGSAGPATSDARAGATVGAQQRAAELFDLYQRLIATRKSERALTHGAFTVLATHNDDNTIAYRRHVDDTERDAIVAINNDVVAKDVRIPMTDVATDGTRFRDALTGREHVVESGALVLDDLDGNWGAVLLRDV